VFPEWGLPSAIISDRDPKFLSEFWKSLFTKANTKILTSTAYHPETDGQSERTNQTIEVALRYYISERQTNWADAIDIIQAAIMTSVHATTGKTPGELLYGINPRHALELSNPATSNATASDDWAEIREVMRKDAADAIGLAQALMKMHADKSRQEFELKVGDKAFIRLHKGYHLPGIPKPKIRQQRAGPFEVETIVGTNAYKLKLPTTWRIWPVISSVYLDKAPVGPDPFNREELPPSAIVTDESLDEDRWEVAAVVRKRMERGKIKYLVRWKGFGPEDDWWINEEEMKDSALLVKEYEYAAGNTAWQPPASWNLTLEQILRQDDGNKEAMENVPRNEEDVAQPAEDTDEVAEHEKNEAPGPDDEANANEPVPALRRSARLRN